MTALIVAATAAVTASIGLLLRYGDPSRGRASRFGEAMSLLGAGTALVAMAIATAPDRPDHSEECGVVIRGNEPEYVCVEVNP